jgi:membrane protein YqaA with SNARE-associated domain
MDRQMSETYRSLRWNPAAAGQHAACHAVRVLAHQLLLVTTDHLMAAGILQTLRRAVVAFLAVVFAVGLFVGGLVGFFLGRVVGRRG